MEKDIYKFSETIETKEDFIQFLTMLRNDLVTNEEEWENPTLDRFLDAFERYCIDVPLNTANWKSFATLFLAAKVYE